MNRADARRAAAKRWAAGGEQLGPSRKRLKDPVDGAATVAIRAAERWADRAAGRDDDEPPMSRDSLAAWAEELGVTLDPPAVRRLRRNVSRAAADAGAPPAPAPAPPTSPPLSERDRRVVEAVKAGQPYRVVAEQVGLSRQRIAQIAKAAGVRRRSGVRYDMEASA